jgi:hypothetical protein
MDRRQNKDGSVDIYCGPKVPAGFEKNWIPTVPGKNWFAYFRFYQPTEAYFDRSCTGTAAIFTDRVKAAPCHPQGIVAPDRDHELRQSVLIAA